MLILVVALIVIPPEQLPSVIQSVGKVLRELRSASNELMREIADSIQESPTATPSATTTSPPKPLDAPPQETVKPERPSALRDQQ
ncbi:MAG TPA: twin-arginine translocase TatA/TatE family subunit [Candidatus Binataceae bacterium]